MKWYSHENKWERVCVCCFWGDGEVKQHLLARGHRLTAGPDTPSYPDAMTRTLDRAEISPDSLSTSVMPLCHKSQGRDPLLRLTALGFLSHTMDGTVMYLFWRLHAKRVKGIERKGSRVEERFVGESREFIRSVVGLWGDISMVNCSPACSQASSWRLCICCSNYTAAPETDNGTFFVFFASHSPSCHKYHICHAKLGGMWRTKK